MRYSGVVFDWDGTLLNSIKSAYEAVCRICEECGASQPSRDEYSGKLRFPYIPFFREMGVKISDEEFWRLYHEYSNHKHSRFFPDAKRTVELLRSMGIAIGIASGQREDVVMSRLGELCAGGTHISFVATDLASKSSTLIRFCTMHKCRPRDILMVGDFVADVLDAREVGVISVGLTREEVSPRVYWRAGANYVIDHLDSLIAIMDDAN